MNPRMAKKKAPLSPAQIANQVTFLLKGHLKNVQLSYLRVGALLARVRDEKLWKLLKHGSIESYAQSKLGISRATLYRYLQIFEWVSERHPEWLRPKPKACRSIGRSATRCWCSTRAAGVKAMAAPVAYRRAHRS